MEFTAFLLHTDSVFYCKAEWSYEQLQWKYRNIGPPHRRSWRGGSGGNGDDTVPTAAGRFSRCGVPLQRAATGETWSPALH
jgi:hypothetical protein